MSSFTRVLSTQNKTSTNKKILSVFVSLILVLRMITFLEIENDKKHHKPES